MLRFDVLTLFPAMFDSLTQLGVTGRAFQQQLWQCQAWNPRDYALDAHKTVDDRPYGGGPGMVMMVEPLEKALCDAQAHRQQTGLPAANVYLTSPRGERFTQKTAHAWNHQEGAILICGRYEGVDQRFIDQHVDAEISLGDFVLSGGEFAALAMMDACVRLVPGVLNDHQSALQDSFEESLSGLLDCPHYTRPENYNGFSIPDVLLSGHHAKIALWRRQESLRLTFEKRPDLILEARRLGQLSSQDERFLANLR